MILRETQTDAVVMPSDMGIPQSSPRATIKGLAGHRARVQANFDGVGCDAELAGSVCNWQDRAVAILLGAGRRPVGHGAA